MERESETFYTKHATPASLKVTQGRKVAKVGSQQTEPTVYRNPQALSRTAASASAPAQ